LATVLAPNSICLERGTEALSRIEIGGRERRLSPKPVSAQGPLRIGRKRFEVFESCRRFIYGVCRDVSTRPDGSILKGPQCGEGFT
jgi:hypothetical protein